MNQGEETQLCVECGTLKKTFPYPIKPPFFQAERMRKYAHQKKGPELNNAAYDVKRKKEKKNLTI